MVREFYIDCNGEQIAAASFMNKSDKCVILMNGFSHSKSDFDYFYTDIAKKLYCDERACSVLFDYVGHGDSTGTMDNGSIKTLSDSLHAVIKAVTTEGKYSEIILVGIGIAGIILHCLFNSSNDPGVVQAISKIILLNPAVETPALHFLDDGDEFFMPSRFVNHEQYDLFDNLDNPVIFWFANLGCHIENVLGRRFRRNLLNDINNMMSGINYKSFPVETILINDKDKLPLNPIQKEDIYVKICNSL